MLLFSTFVSGLHGPVGRLASPATAMLDGGVLYESRDASTAPDPPWANNTFEVLAWENCENGDASLHAFIKRALRKPLRLGREAGGKSFRVVASHENRLVSIDPNIKRQAETLIAKRTGLAPDRGGTGLEYWFLSRSEGFLLFMKRLTYHPPYDKSLPKGTLAPPLCYLLNYLADPRPGDVLLDPFCGSSAIKQAAQRHFDYAAFHESDLAKGRDINDLLSWVAPGSINKIITDPPWGFFDGGADLPTLYAAMLAVFSQVLVPGGRIVLLTAQKDLLADLLQKQTALSPEETHHILVSGKKAGVFVMAY